MPTHYVDKLSAVTGQSVKAGSVRITTQPCCAKHVLRPQMDRFYQVDGKIATIGDAIMPDLPGSELCAMRV
jgi:hypothetical protein